jgi:hypothetical protein
MLAGAGSNSDAVAVNYVTATVAANYPWVELTDQTGRSEDMSFTLFTSPAQPTTHAIAIVGTHDDEASSAPLTHDYEPGVPKQ